MKTIDEWLNDYQLYRETYGLSINMFRTLKTFRNWCFRAYPGDIIFRQEMFDIWGAKHEHETGISHASRIFALNSLIKYMNNRGEKFKLVEHGPVNPYTDPRTITEEEFKNILRAADEIEIKPEGHRFHLSSMITALTMPVYLRLLYSSGIRAPEGRLLAREDVDFVNSIVVIKRGKGYKERIIALDRDMAKLMEKYDNKIDALIPNRVPFFPSAQGEYRSNYWFSTQWRHLYQKYNVINTKEDMPVQYSLRHNYIIENIERLPQDGYNKDIRLMAISQSVGHVSVENTIKYYYHLTPRSGDILDAKMGSTFDFVIPDIDIDDIEFE